jgi:ubiquinone/menaquinone biosynthesis C-methylase UbiE
LHLISPEKLKSFVNEIDRVLKPGGALIFFEPDKFLSWDSEKLKSYFTSIGYKIDINRLNPRVIIKGRK